MAAVPPRRSADADELLARLDDLATFAAVARAGGIAAAATGLRTSPTSLARGVTGLERTLGLSLLERRGRGAVPTAAGASLLARFERIAIEVAAGRAELERMPGTSRAAILHLFSSGRKLLLLIHLAATGTVSGAAASLAMTQPGASMALARIERSLGVRLFHRSLRGVFPTDPAARLILRAQRIRAELRHALGELPALAGSAVGTAVIGTLPMARAGILPRAIGDCLDVAPQLRVQIVEAQREALIAQLRTGEIDAILAVPGAGLDAADLIVEPLFTDRLGVVAAADHPLAGAARVPLGDLASSSWILPWDKAVSRALFDRQFASRGIAPPAAAVETGDLLVMRPLLARGEMLAFTSLGLVQVELAAGVLVRIDADMDEVWREVVLLRRRTATLPASTRILLDHIRRVAAGIDHHTRATGEGG